MAFLLPGVFLREGRGPVQYLDTRHIVWLGMSTDFEPADHDAILKL